MRNAVQGNPSNLKSSWRTMPGWTLLDRQTDRHTDRQTDKQTDRQTERQTNRQTNKQKDSHADRQTERQANRQTWTDRQTHTQSYFTKKCWLRVCVANLVDVKQILSLNLLPKFRRKQSDKNEQLIIYSNQGSIGS